ncbi:hypothetical protein [Lactococcus cremoris]|uniref:hypothetical protein n=1 Tax=Lactococcus lactis subsp. cremoris TaxID=1359 RepID=UPI0024A71EC1|nr:hypothetical protein [Lactococcus cremoris]
MLTQASIRNLKAPSWSPLTTMLTQAFICNLKASSWSPLTTMLTQAFICNLKAPPWSLPAIAHCYSNHYSILS